MTATEDPTAFPPNTRSGSPIRPVIVTQTDSPTTSVSYSWIEDSGSSSAICLTSDKPSVLNVLRRKTGITILLIGETGVGKTAFMSLLANLFQGRGVLQLEDKHDKSGESGLSKSQSQTTKATFYTISTSDGRQINILDTPGLADTRGIAQDNLHKAEINRAIKEYITTIDAVLILANGSVPRLGAATEYTLSILTSMFPYSILENIGFMFTNSDLDGLNFEMDNLPVELRESKHWAIQNPLGRLNSFNRSNGGPGLCTKGQLKKLDSEYGETVDTLKKWLEWLDERPVAPTNEIHELYEKSITIESKIEASLSSITRLSEQRKVWTKIAADLGDIKYHKDAVEAAVIQQTSPVWVREPSESYNTICVAADCYSNCHTPCSWIFVTSPRLLRYLCSAFPGWSMTCQFCKHEVEQHRRYKYIHVQKQGELNEKTRLEWENAQTDAERLQAAQNAAQRELDRIEADTIEMQAEIHQLIDDYNNISLSKNFCGHIRSALQVLDYRKTELQSKAGTDAELTLVDGSIAKLREKLGIIDERTSFLNKGRNALRKAEGMVKSAVNAVAEIRDVLNTL